MEVIDMEVEMKHGAYEIALWREAYVAEQNGFTKTADKLRKKAFAESMKKQNPIPLQR